jgi:hypothetical protein
VLIEILDIPLHQNIIALDNQEILGIVILCRIREVE